MKKRPTWPKIRLRRNCGGTVSYVVDLGKLASESEHRPRRSFKSKTEAEAYAAAKRRERNEGGLGAVTLTEIKRAEWAHCEKLAQEKGRSILEVVQIGLQAMAGLILPPQVAPAPVVAPATAKPTTAKTVAEVIEEYAADLRWKNRNKRNHDNAHARITRGVLRKALGAMLDRSISELTLPDLKDAISVATERSAHKVHWAIQALFAFAAKEGRRYLVEDVAIGLGRASKPTADDDEDEPAILALWEVRALLYTAQSREEFHELLPCLAVQLFNGPRLSETKKLSPLELDPSFDEIRLGPGVAKREARRSPEYHPTLKAWLRAFPPTKPKLVPPGYHAKLRKLRQVAGLVRGQYAPVPDVCPNPPEWERSIFRHTYGSNFYGFTQDKQKTLYNMGHTSPRTFFKHYATCIRKHHAEAYWAILPLSAEELAEWLTQKMSGKTMHDLYPAEQNGALALA
jgi:hypothetical protein